MASLFFLLFLYALFILSYHQTSKHPFLIEAFLSYTLALIVESDKKLVNLVNWKTFLKGSKTKMKDMGIRAMNIDAMVNLLSNTYT